MWKFSLNVSSIVSSYEETLLSTLVLESSTSSSAVVIDNENISNITDIDGINNINIPLILGDIIILDSNNDDTVVILDGSKITSTGTVSIYTDIILQGDATITSSKCISTYNNSNIVIDLTTRTKDELEVLKYNCTNIPELDIELQGSYSDGCIPRYEIKQTSLILIFDTQSCQEPNTENDIWIPIIIIGSIVCVCMIIIILFIIVYTNESIRANIFINRTATKTSISMTDIGNKMKRIDEQIESTTAKVNQLNAILDE